MGRINDFTIVDVCTDDCYSGGDEQRTSVLFFWHYVSGESEVKGPYHRWLADPPSFVYKGIYLVLFILQNKRITKIGSI